MAHDLFHVFCIHYPHGGLAENEACKKDIRFYTLKTDMKLGYPCWLAGVGGCEAAEYPTPEELSERTQLIKEHLEKMVKFMRQETKECIHCGKTVRHLRLEGRDVYGDCGCRMWQGRVPIDWLVTV